MVLLFKCPVFRSPLYLHCSLKKFLVFLGHITFCFCRFQAILHFVLVVFRRYCIQFLSFSGDIAFCFCRFQAILQAILRHVNFEVTKCVLLASPGFTKDQVPFYMPSSQQYRPWFFESNVPAKMQTSQPFVCS